MCKRIALGAARPVRPARLVRRCSNRAQANAALRRGHAMRRARVVLPAAPRSGGRLEAAAQLVRLHLAPARHRRTLDRQPARSRSPATCAGTASHVVLDRVPDEDGTARLLAARLRARRLAGARASHATPTTSCTSTGAAMPNTSPDARAAAHHAQAQGQEGRVTDPHRFDADVWAAYEAIYAESWKPEEGDPALLRPSPKPKARPAACGSASPGTRATRSPRRSGRSRTAPPTSTSSPISKAPSHCRRAPMLTAALFEQVDRQRPGRNGRFRHRRRPYKRDWMEESRPRYRARNAGARPTRATGRRSPRRAAAHACLARNPHG